MPVAAKPAAVKPAAAKSSSRKSKRKRAAIPRTRKPDGMSLEQWQVALRREFGRQQRFRLLDVGGAGVFSEFNVTNPQSKRTYRVSIRGENPGDNHCTCPDFAVNTLGTCKHIEFTLARMQRRTEARRLLRQGYRPPFSEIYLRYGARREVALRRGADWPAELDRRLASYLDGDLLRPGAFERFEQFLEELRRGDHGRDHEVRCYDDAIAFIAQCRDRAALVTRIGSAFPGGEQCAALDDLLKVTLYPYQRRGALFAARAGRSLLADDMGLGKTIQALAAAEILARAGGVERVLIVAPTSLKHQWKQEIERFTSRDALVIEGPADARRAGYGQGAFYKIANYETLHHDLGAVAAMAPDLVILDEAQRIKNWKTRTAQVVKQLPSQHAIVLTGTPLENRLEELHSIVEFVDRFRLGPSFRFLAEHQKVDEDGRVVGYRNLSQISKTLEPIVLRRTKSQVLGELPQRLEKHLYFPLTPQQREHHEENRQVVARIVAKWRRFKFLAEADQRRLTAALQNMRMVCNSTYLLDAESEYGPKPDEIVAQLGQALEDRDAKVVIFSQWLRSHELLARRLEKQRRKFVLFHGGVPGPRRQDLIARFKDEADCRVFLSTDAGGVGLNLQNASAVFNMDLPWNPAVLEQRIGRVHRLGQQRPVNVLHFVTENSIEYGMLDVLRFKKSLFAGVLDGGQDEVFLGGTRLKRFMESVEAAAGGIGNGAAQQAGGPVVPSPDATDSTSATATATATHHPISTRSDEGRGGIDDSTQLLNQLISAGRNLLDGLAQAIASPPQEGSGNARPADGSAITVERDGSTGRSYLKLPLPAPDALGRATLWIQALAGALQNTR
ncbi:MAG: DEAD/DEAH box helicase [Tepidisphaeraceae bacterium]